MCSEYLVRYIPIAHIILVSYSSHACLSPPTGGYHNDCEKGAFVHSVTSCAFCSLPASIVLSVSCAGVRIHRTSHGDVQPIAHPRTTWIHQISSVTGLSSADAFNLAMDRFARRAVATAHRKAINGDKVKALNMPSVRLFVCRVATT